MVLYNHGKRKENYSDIRKVVYYMMYTTKEMIAMVTKLLDETCQIFGLENDETIKLATLCEDFVSNIDKKNEIDLSEIFIAHHMAKIRYAEEINEE